ncbi:MAG: tyrosine-type recombinase/integrase [Butyricicoccus sp.]
MHSFDVCSTVFAQSQYRQALHFASAATYLCYADTESGVPISVVSKWLGHANISTTYNTYIHVLCSEEKDAAELLKAM